MLSPYLLRLVVVLCPPQKAVLVVIRVFILDISGGIGSHFKHISALNWLISIGRCQIE